MPAGVNTHRNGRGPGRVRCRSIGCSNRQHPSLVEASSFKAGGDGWTSSHPSSLPSSASSGHRLGAFVSFRVVPGTFGGWLGKAANFWVCTSRILSRGTGRFNRVMQRPCESRAGVGVSVSWEWLASHVARVVVVFLATIGAYLVPGWSVKHDTHFSWFGVFLQRQGHVFWQHHHRLFARAFRTHPNDATVGQPRRSRVCATIWFRTFVRRVSFSGSVSFFQLVQACASMPPCLSLVVSCRGRSHAWYPLRVSCCASDPRRRVRPLFGFAQAWSPAPFQPSTFGFACVEWHGLCSTCFSFLLLFVLLLRLFRVHFVGSACSTYRPVCFLFLGSIAHPHACIFHGLGCQGVFFSTSWWYVRSYVLVSTCVFPTIERCGRGCGDGWWCAVVVVAVVHRRFQRAMVCVCVCCSTRP